MLAKSHPEGVRLGLIMIARLAPHPSPLSHRDYLRVARRGEGEVKDRDI
jgi:hypothetical protein